MDVEATEFRFEKWRKTTVSGAMLTGIALGLREALDGDQDRPAIVMPAPESKPRDEPFQLHLDPDHPEYTVAIVRPWLFS